MVIKAAIIFQISRIWKAKNDIKYNNKKISIIDSINMIDMKARNIWKNLLGKFTNFNLIILIYLEKEIPMLITL